MDKINLRYQRGKIYTVRCYDDDSLIYVGSTIDKLSARMAKHRYDKTCSLYQYVNNNFNGDWNNLYIELYEEYPCNNKQLLEKREGEITRLIGNINKRIEGRTKKEWTEENKEHCKKKKKEYRNDNKEKLKEYEKNRPRVNNETEIIKHKQYKKDYYETNKEIIAEKRKQKVVCERCGCEIVKSYLKRHQKTKKCLEKQNIIIK